MKTIRFKVYASRDGMDRFLLEAYLLSRCGGFKLAPGGRGYFAKGGVNEIRELRNDGYKVITF